MNSTSGAYFSYSTINIGSNTDDTRPCLRNCLFGIADPGVHRVGRSITFFFFYQKKMEVSASNPFEMQAKLYAELTDDIFRYYSVPNNSQLKHKTSLSEPLSEAIKPTIVEIRNGFSDVLHFTTGVALQCGDLRAIYFRGSHR